jgi:hypothetical protein
MLIVDNFSTPLSMVGKFRRKRSSKYIGNMNNKNKCGLVSDSSGRVDEVLRSNPSTANKKN